MGKALILFGAGASYGSDTGGTPPLGQALFAALQAFDPKTWGQIPLAEAKDFRADFEQGMKAYTEAHASDGTVDRLQRAMAACFFQFAPRASSLYVSLAQRIRACNWNGALASLNYERLLECSLRHVGINVVVGGTKDRATELCLPHGCCHLFGQIRTAGNVVFGQGIRFDGPGIRLIEDPQKHADELQTSTVPPVMCYFQPDKQARAGVSFINGQRGRFARLVEEAQTVAIIGVKVRPIDKHIWDPLAGTPAQIIYCAGECAARKFEAWATAHGRGRDHAIPTYWGDAFDDVCKAISL